MRLKKCFNWIFEKSYSQGYYMELVSKCNIFQTLHQILMKFGRKLWGMVYQHIGKVLYAGKILNLELIHNLLENNRIKKTIGFFSLGMNRNYI